ncbi:MAG: HEAT repeat domain-containing protein [Xenococcaceae cyanobacterium]
MEIQQIQEYLDSPDPQSRLKALTELKNYDTETVVPLLKSKMNDPEFLVRSFVAMGLGKKQNAESFAALLELIEFDRDDHWLVRRSILAALVEIDSPEELFEVCLSGLSGEDLTVKEASIDCFGYLANTSKRDAALTQLLSLVDDEWWRTRMRVAIALTKFNEPQAREALEKLRQDRDHRVVGAVLESQI